jgi:hypothetical protein
MLKGSLVLAGKKVIQQIYAYTEKLLAVRVVYGLDGVSGGSARPGI